MNVLCAPDSFKEALAATEAAAAMARGVQAAGAQADECPIADGGEGTVRAMVGATGGRIFTQPVTGPTGRKIEAAWGMLGEKGTGSSIKTAVIEMAAASGLALVPMPHRDPTKTTTFGTGQLIVAALAAGARRIILGIGGSGTCDGGCGAAQALGVRFLDDKDNTIDSPMTGADLLRVARVDISGRDPRLPATDIAVACDVTNPLTGANGAAPVYAPQKGATAEQVRRLDQGLGRLASVVRRDLKIDIETLAGSGAAGGFGGGAVAFLGGQLRSGIQMILDVVGFQTRAAGCDLCLTGEGQLDAQSLAGKAVVGVAQAARRCGVPTVALVGSIKGDKATAIEAGLNDVLVIGEALPRQESIARTAELLEAAAKRVVESRAKPVRHPDP